MKKLLVILLISLMLILTGCLTNDEKNEIEPTVKAEDLILENAYKGIEVQNESYRKALAVFEKSSVVPMSIKRSMKRASTEAELELSEQLNAYFDELDEAVLSEEEENQIVKELEPVMEYFEENMPKPIENVFGNNVPSGFMETEETINIGGDIILDKRDPENAVIISNLVREVKGLPPIEEEEVKSQSIKRGFYSNRSGWFQGVKFWPKGKVKYRFDGPNNSQKNAIKQAMREWERVSDRKVHFSEYKNKRWNKFRWKVGLSQHVKITSKNDGSYATLGRKRWAYMNIDDFSQDTILHELGHVLGLMHEHQRPDRDDYILVNTEAAQNINGWSDSKIKNNYEKIGEKSYRWFLKNDIKATEQYDYQSIMHYPSQMFNGEYSIVRKDGKVSFYGRPVVGGYILSDLDKEFIKTLY